MRTGVFAVLVVVVLAFGDSASGQGPPVYKNTLDWDTNYPQGGIAKVTAKVTTQVKPGYKVTEITYKVWQGNSKGQGPPYPPPYKQHGPIANPNPPFGHTFTQLPAGQYFIEVEAKFEDANMNAETKAVSGTANAI